MNRPFLPKTLMRAISCMILTAFVGTSVIPPSYAQTAPWMPQPGTLVALSPAFTPAHLKGMVIDPNAPFKFDFIVDKGDEPLSTAQKQDEYQKLIKYFLAALAVPDKEQWVNLSPYEQDRIIPDSFGLTGMGRDLLAQDYLLKQIASSLTNPDEALGKKFWDQVYAQAHEKFGTTDIPASTINKVWIVPDKADMYEKDNTVIIVDSHLKVMLEEDYLALQQNAIVEPSSVPQADEMGKATSRIMREIIIPAIEKEVNEGKNFAPLRQVVSGMILATWYKMRLKETILGKVYADKAKLKGIDQDPKANQEIYTQYVEAFKKGVFNMIKEDVDQLTQEIIPRKYFSGGFERAMLASKMKISGELAMSTADAVRDRCERAMGQLEQSGRPSESAMKTDQPVADWVKGNPDAAVRILGAMVGMNMVGTQRRPSSASPEVFEKRERQGSTDNILLRMSGISRERGSKRDVVDKALAIAVRVEVEPPEGVLGKTLAKLGQVRSRLSSRFQPVQTYKVTYDLSKLLADVEPLLVQKFLEQTGGVIKDSVYEDGFGEAADWNKRNRSFKEEQIQRAVRKFLESEAWPKDAELKDSAERLALKNRALRQIRGRLVELPSDQGGVIKIGLRSEAAMLLPSVNEEDRQLVHRQAIQKLPKTPWPVGEGFHRRAAAVEDIQIRARKEVQKAAEAVREGDRARAWLALAHARAYLDAVEWQLTLLRPLATEENQLALSTYDSIHAEWSSLLKEGPSEVQKTTLASVARDLLIQSNKNLPQDIKKGIRIATTSKFKNTFFTPVRVVDVLVPHFVKRLMTGRTLEQVRGQRKRNASFQLKKFLLGKLGDPLVVALVMAQVEAKQDGFGYENHEDHHAVGLYYRFSNNGVKSLGDLFPSTKEQMLKAIADRSTQLGQSLDEAPDLVPVSVVKAAFDNSIKSGQPLDQIMFVIRKLGLGPRSGALVNLFSEALFYAQDIFADVSRDPFVSQTGDPESIREAFLGQVSKAFLTWRPSKDLVRFAAKVKSFWPSVEGQPVATERLMAESVADFFSVEPIKDKAGEFRITMSPVYQNAFPQRRAEAAMKAPAKTTAPVGKESKLEFGRPVAVKVGDVVRVAGSWRIGQKTIELTLEVIVETRDGKPILKGRVFAPRIPSQSEFSPAAGRRLEVNLEKEVEGGGYVPALTTFAQDEIVRGTKEPAKDLFLQARTQEHVSFLPTVRLNENNELVVNEVSAVLENGYQVAAVKISSESAPAAVGDEKAMGNGGIDLNSANLDMQIKRDGQGMVLPVDQQDLDNIKIDGLVPVILNIQPASTLPLFSQLQAQAAGVGGNA